MNKRPIQVAMFGGGINSAVGRVHEIALKMDNVFELCAGCFSKHEDINKETGKSYYIHNDRVYSTPEELLGQEAENIEAIVIATPIDSHFSLVNMALDYGIKVICDKPIVSNTIEGDQLVRRIGRQSSKVFSIFNYTGYPAIREIRQRVKLGEIGSVFKIMAEMPQDTYLRLKNQGKVQNIQTWRLTDGVIPCVSLDLFIHLHSLVYFITGNMVESVFAIQRSISDVSPGLVDEVDAMITYTNNLTVNCWYGKVALGYRNGLKIRIFGTKGSFEWVQEDPEIIYSVNALGDRSILDRISSSSLISSESRYSRFRAGHPSGFLEAFANYYVDIATAITTNALNDYTLPVEVALEGLRLSEAIATSSREHSAAFL